MKLSLDEFVTSISDKLRILDVRAPVEFAQGALPNSVNLPILNDEERHLVGACYKQNGREAAIKLGHKIVSGENKIRKLNAWKDFLKENPEAVLTCFRGGLRSQITQSFLHEAGVDRPRLEKGYKQVRQHFIDSTQKYSETQVFRIVTGNTGCGKTRFIQEMKSEYPCIDLEDLAKHRGSAFGKLPGTPQPSQASFENLLAWQILEKTAESKSPILYEDESRLIGSLHLPEVFFIKLRQSKVIKLKVSLQQRIQNIFEDYVLFANLKNDDQAEKLYASFAASIAGIQKKLGDVRAKEILADMNLSYVDFLQNRQLETNKVWIEKLLVWYYDPIYEYSINKRNPEVELEAEPPEVRHYLRETVFSASNN